MNFGCTFLVSLLKVSSRSCNPRTEANYRRVFGSWNALDDATRSSSEVFGNQHGSLCSVPSVQSEFLSFHLPCPRTHAALDRFDPQENASAAKVMIVAACLFILGYASMFSASLEDLRDGS